MNPESRGEAPFSEPDNGVFVDGTSKRYVRVPSDHQPVSPLAEDATPTEALPVISNPETIESKEDTVDEAVDEYLYYAHPHIKMILPKLIKLGVIAIPVLALVGWLVYLSLAHRWPTPFQYITWGVAATAIAVLLYRLRYWIEMWRGITYYITDSGEAGINRSTNVWLFIYRDQSDRTSPGAVKGLQIGTPSFMEKQIFRNVRTVTVKTSAEDGAIPPMTNLKDYRYFQQVINDVSRNDESEN